MKDLATKETFDPEHNVAKRLHEAGELGRMSLRRKLKMIGLQSPYLVYLYPGCGTVDGTRGDHILIAPPFNITDHDVDEIVNRTCRLIEDFPFPGATGF